MDVSDQVSAEANENTPPPSVIELELNPLRLSFSLMRATLSYRLTLRNIGKMPVVSLRVHSDLISAHASRPEDEQLLGPDMGQAHTQKIAQLGPEQSIELKGDRSLLLAEVEVIHHGSKKMILPLIRFRLIGAGTPPLIRAFVVGQPAPDGGKLRPFRLDSGTAQRDEIAAHALD